MDTTTQDTLALKEAAAHLGLNPVTLKRKANAGKLTAYRTGAGHWVFKRDDLDKFAADYLALKPYVAPTAD